MTWQFRRKGANWQTQGVKKWSKLGKKFKIGQILTFFGYCLCNGHVHLDFLSSSIH